MIECNFSISKTQASANHDPPKRHFQKLYFRAGPGQAGARRRIPARRRKACPAGLARENIDAEP